MSEAVEPCPTCAEGWRQLDKGHCAGCYEGKIERLTAVLSWLEERARNSTSFGSHCHAYEVAARKVKEVLEDGAR